MGHETWGQSKYFENICRYLWTYDKEFCDWWWWGKREKSGVLSSSAEQRQKRAASRPQNNAYCVCAVLSTHKLILDNFKHCTWDAKNEAHAHRSFKKSVANDSVIQQTKLHFLRKTKTALTCYEENSNKDTFPVCLQRVFMNDNEIKSLPAHSLELKMSYESRKVYIFLYRASNFLVMFVHNDRHALLLTCAGQQRMIGIY